MSKRLKRNSLWLKYLSRSKPSMRRAMIKAADKDMVDTLCECCLNVLNGNIPLTPSQKKKLSKYKLTLRGLVRSKKTSYKRKKKALLTQKGGFLGALLATLAGAVLPQIIESVT